MLLVLPSPWIKEFEKVYPEQKVKRRGGNAKQLVIHFYFFLLLLLSWSLYPSQLSLATNTEQLFYTL